MAPRRVAQDSKTAALGVCAAPSQTVIKTDKILECHCKFIKQECKEDLNFILYYRKPQYLFEKGIMLACPGDGETDEDEDRPDQGPSRKRLRIQPSVDQNALIEQREKEVEDLTRDDDDDDDDHFDDNSNDREEIHIDLTLNDDDDDDEDNKIIPPFRFFIRDVR